MDDAKTRKDLEAAKPRAAIKVYLMSRVAEDDEEEVAELPPIIQKFYIARKQCDEMFISNVESRHSLKSTLKTKSKQISTRELREVLEV